MATVSLRDKIASLPKGEQKAIAERAEVLKAEVRTLRELRKAQDITQVQLAHEMGVTQETVSRMEKRGNMLVATLSKTIQKLGGELVIMAKFPRLGTVRVDLGDGLLVSNEEAVRVRSGGVPATSLGKGKRKIVRGSKGASGIQDATKGHSASKKASSRARKSPAKAHGHGRGRHLLEA